MKPVIIGSSIVFYETASCSSGACALWREMYFYQEKYKKERRYFFKKNLDNRQQASIEEVSVWLFPPLGTIILVLTLSTYAKFSEKLAFLIRARTCENFAYLLNTLCINHYIMLVINSNKYQTSSLYHHLNYAHWNYFKHIS